MTKKTKDQEENLLENFQWDDNDDWFSISEEEKTVEETEETEEDLEESSEEKEDEKKDEEVLKTEENDNLFNFDSPEETEEKETEKSDEKDEMEVSDEEDAEFFLNFAKDLKERGITTIDFDPEEIKSEDQFFELQDKEIESRVDEVLSSWGESLGEDGKAFIQFKKNGGNTEDFFKVYSQSYETPQGDLEDEKYQERLNKYYYSTVEGLEAEEVEEKIEWLKDSGKLAKTAERNQNKLDKLDAKRKEDLAIQAQNSEKARIEKEKELTQAIANSINNTEEVRGISLKEDKKSFINFMTKRNVKLGKNIYATGFQTGLQKALQDPEKLLLIGKLIENDFDFSDIAKKEVTKEVKNVRSNLRRSRNLGSSGKKQTRELADFFDE